MSDPLRTDGSRAHADVASGSDRDAKIEQLLLVGLDHYFAAHYEQAINVWTRALFLDRSHARARAYIERARSALAERQRESEELLQNGVAAFQRGEGDEARRLLQAAIDGGAPSDEALAVLDRLNRSRRPSQAPAGSHRSRRRASRRRARAESVALVGGALGGAAIACWRGTRRVHGRGRLERHHRLAVDRGARQGRGATEPAPAPAIGAGRRETGACRCRAAARPRCFARAR